MRKKTMLITQLWQPMRWCHSRVSKEVPNPNTNGKDRANKHELKKHIRKLYQIIHPDRLHKFPNQRRINESSFQLLQSALDRHLKTPSQEISSPKSSHPNQLTFFACPEDVNGGVNTISDSASNKSIIGRTYNNGELHKAVISFRETQLATALLDLFKALGLEEPPARALAALGKPHIRRPRLRDLVELARNMRTDATTRTYEENSAFLQQTIYRAYGAHIEMKDRSFMNGDEALRRIANVLVDSKANIRPVVVSIDNSKIATVETDSDAGDWAPRVRLGTRAPTSSWHITLHSPVLTSLCSAARARASYLHRCEAAAARALGVRLVLCEKAATNARDSYDNALLNSYKDLISALSKNECYYIMRDSLHPDIHLLVVVITRGSSIIADSNSGLLQVGVDCGPRAVINAVRGANSVASTYRQVSEMRAADKKLCLDVRRSMHAAHIRRGPGLNDTQWRTSLQRLLARAHMLRKITGGMSLVVGTQTRLLDSGEIEIAYDFDANDFL